MVCNTQLIVFVAYEFTKTRFIFSIHCRTQAICARNICVTKIRLPTSNWYGGKGCQLLGARLNEDSLGSLVYYYYYYLTLNILLLDTRHDDVSF